MVNSFRQVILNKVSTALFMEFELKVNGRGDPKIRD